MADFPPIEAPVVLPLADNPVPPRLQFSALAGPGLRSLRRNWPAIVGLQAAGLAVVVGYYAADPFRHACDALARAKAAGGVWAAAGIMAFVAGVVPEVAKAVFGIDRSVTVGRLRNVSFNLLLYGVLGVFVNAFYNALAAGLGERATPGVVVAKVLIDQFVYTPVLGVVLIALAYTWRETRYGLRRTFARLGRHWYVTRVVILLLPNWAYWIPMTALMYTLPPGLTFVFGASASAAAALLLTSIASEGAGAQFGTPDRSR